MDARDVPGLAAEKDKHRRYVDQPRGRVDAERPCDETLERTTLRRDGSPCRLATTRTMSTRAGMGRGGERPQRAT